MAVDIPRLSEAFEASPERSVPPPRPRAVEAEEAEAPPGAAAAARRERLKAYLRLIDR